MICKNLNWNLKNKPHPPALNQNIPPYKTDKTSQLKIHKPPLNENTPKQTPPTTGRAGQKIIVNTSKWGRQI
jgi:hypothetical protein